MWLKQLDLQHFRNYKQNQLQFHPHLNIFIGQNAQGKTNLLESIYFLALTRSHRTRSDKDLILFDNNSLSVSGILHRKRGDIPLEINLTPRGRTTKLNHLVQSKVSDYVGTMNIVLFSPEDLQLIKGAPALRRKFMDMELGQMKPLYLSDLSHYYYLLKQRNTYLKQEKQLDKTFLSVLDEQLVHYGSRVIRQRMHFVTQLQSVTQKKYQEISNQGETITMSYQSSVLFKHLDQIEAVFEQKLKQSHAYDQLKKTTSIGPHRDDLTFFMNHRNASFGSQGQHRSLILSIKLAEIELMETITHEKPILLLDDVLSELDHSRQMRLLAIITQGTQTFLTTTSLDTLQISSDSFSLFTIQNGEIKQ